VFIFSQEARRLEEEAAARKREEAARRKEEEKKRKEEEKEKKRKIEEERKQEEEERRRLVMVFAVFVQNVIRYHQQQDISHLGFFHLRGFSFFTIFSFVVLHDFQLVDSVHTPTWECVCCLFLINVVPTDVCNSQYCHLNCIC